MILYLNTENGKLCKIRYATSILKLITHRDPTADVDTDALHSLLGECRTTSHHRNRRSASALVSELDNIPGVGAVSREKLVTRYRTISRIKKAPYREIVNVIGKRSADALFDWFAMDKS